MFILQFMFMCYTALVHSVSPQHKLLVFLTETVTCVTVQTQVVDVFSVVWKVLEPMLYAFIGAEIDVTVLDLDTVLWGVALILGALVVSTNAYHLRFCNDLSMTAHLKF